MPDLRNSALLPILMKSNNPGGYCVATILAWVMVVDGEIDDKEFELLGSISRNLNFDDVNRIIEGLPNSLIDVQLACEFLSQTFVNRNDHYKLLELVVLMVIADGRLRFSELQALFLIADLFHVGTRMLNKIYRGITHKDLPPYPDFGLRSWWINKYGQRKNENRYKGRPSATKVDEARLKALALLGLGESATQDDIRNAYLKMVQRHHPDKFYALGQEAVKAAEKVFISINASYDYLRAGNA
ncbi:DnaJ domain-containing protein [Maridesulfovibrio sp.]|uniref:DnaJ domain-containing protein n=1 Tax=Maridesulfovibrio sp. TaxID=2795000 RepID=UPI002A18D7CF|nr:DnaJ domain-containing protein [Maridesulfovibrio sp.]